MLTPLDHLLVLVFAVAWPLYITFVEMPRFRRRVAAGEPVALPNRYLRTIALQWAIAAFALFVWRRAGRPLAELGFRWPSGWGLWAGVAIAAAAMAFLWVQLATVRRSEKVREGVRRQIAPLAFFLPHRPAEVRVFLAVAVTAGICEELLFRGYLIWYLERFVGTAVAVGVSTLVFGLAHAYQGRGGMVKAGLAGLVMAAFYLPSRSLLLPAIVHTATDVFGGLTTYEALRERPLLEHQDPLRHAAS